MYVIKVKWDIGIGIAHRPSLHHSADCLTALRGIFVSYTILSIERSNLIISSVNGFIVGKNLLNLCILRRLL